MKRILVCNQKGGVGKSLIADELAFSFERSNIPTAFIDLDLQGGVIHKMNRRTDAEVAVIDTPGAYDSDNFKKWLPDADVVVIPTRPSSRDIEPLLLMRRTVRLVRPDVPLLYVVNGFNRFRASSDFLEWFREQAPDAEILTLPQSEQFIRAAAELRSVVDYARSGPVVDATLELCNRVRKMSGFPAEV